MHDTSPPRDSFLNGWRVAGWGSLAALLALPALAMQLTGEVRWTVSDFVFAAILLTFAGSVVELAVRFARPGAPRIGYVIAGLAAFLTIWINGAVGIIGDEDAVNDIFYILLIAAILVGCIFRFRAAAMRWIAGMLVMGQYAMGVAALGIMPGHEVEWGLLTVFALLWCTVAWCFGRIAGEPAT